MNLLTAAEKSFLDVFLYEATTAPFSGPATKAIQALGVEYNDIPYLAWAYEQESPRTGIVVGRPAEVAPPVPWPTRELALRRNTELQRIWEKRRPQAVYARL